MKKEPKLCNSVSPQTGRLCLKYKAHNKMDWQVTHQNGPIVWDEFGAEGMLSKTPLEFAEDRFFSDPSATQPEEPIQRAEHAMQASIEFDPVMSMAEVELRGWWFEQAEREVEGTVPKAIEYSSTDLIDIGRTLAYCMARQVSDEEAAELGIFFYLQGKLSRWAGAIKSGERPSDDTIYDIGVYCRMAQRVRYAGGWPGLPKHTEGE